MMGDENYFGGTSCKLLFRKKCSSDTKLEHISCAGLFFSFLGGQICLKAPKYTLSLVANPAWVVDVNFSHFIHALRVLCWCGLHTKLIFVISRVKY